MGQTYTYTVHDEHGNDVTDQVTVWRRDRIVDPGGPITELLEVVQSGVPPTTPQIERAVRWNTDMAKAIKDMLAQNDRFFTEGNAQIEDLEYQLKELRQKVRAVLEGPKINLERLRQAAGMMTRVSHDDCPFCECWEATTDAHD